MNAEGKQRREMQCNNYNLVIGTTVHAIIAGYHFRPSRLLSLYSLPDSYESNHQY